MRRLILAGKTAEEISATTGLGLSDVRRTAGWLKTPIGQQWIQKNSKGTLDGTVPPAPQPTPVKEVARGAAIASRQQAQPESVFIRTDERGGLPPAENDDGTTYALAQFETPEGVRQVMVPVQPTIGKGRGTVNVTSFTLDYYDRANADFLAETAKTTPPEQMPSEYPGGLAGFLEDCVVKYFEVVLGKKLAWVEARR